MGHVEDRWTVRGPEGRRVRGPRHGHGKRWRARWTDPAGIVRSRAFTSKDEANAFLARTDVEVRSGTYIDPDAGRTAVGVYAERWRTTKAPLKEKTRTWYDGLLDNHVLPRWKAVSVGQVTRASVTEWLAGLTCSPSRVRACYVVLRGVLDMAADDRAIAANPAVGVKLPRVTPRDMRPLTAAQVHQLAGLAAEKHPHAGVMVQLLAYGGLRWGELVGLDVPDVAGRRITISRSVTEIAGRQVTTRPKSHAARTVVVPLFLADLLEQVAGEREVGPMFPGPRSSRWYHGTWQRRVWESVTAAIELPDLRVHDLRHTAASLAIAAGADVKVLQRMLGHASAAMTLDVYGGLLDDRLDQVADAVETMTAQARTPQGPPQRHLRAVE